MKNSIDLTEAYADAHQLPSKEKQLDGMTRDQLMDLGASISVLKKPYYRIWYYSKKQWDTGFSQTELDELSANFSLLKVTENMITDVVDTLNSSYTRYIY